MTRPPLAERKKLKSVGAVISDAMPEISSMSITHKWASIEDIERARAENLKDVLEELRSLDGIDECVALQTCNRIEIYIVSSNGNLLLREYSKRKNIPENIIRFHGHEESLQRLFRLATGLESMVIGEDQILGQIKDAFSVAKQVGTVGKILDMAFSKAISVGKRARTETNINVGAVSIGSAAVDLAEQILGGLEGKTVTVIGAGEMGSLVARALSQRNLHTIFVSSRTHAHALELARELDGKAIYFEEIMDYIPQSDVIISATAAPHFIITTKMMQGIKLDKKILLIDIAAPRDIEESVAEISNIELHNIDSLRSIRDANLEKRKAEAKKVERIVEEEFKLLEKSYKQQRADGVISSLYSQVEKIRIQEREKAINRLRSIGEFGEDQIEIIDDLTNSLVNKILAQPTKSLREEAENGKEDFLQSISKLFRL